MKKCSKCKLEKLISDFWRNKGISNQARSVCKNCERLYRKQYYQQHRGDLLKKHNEYNRLHKEETAQYVKLHKKAINERKKKYYRKHKKEMRQRAKKYRDSHKEKVGNWYYKRTHKIDYKKVVTMFKDQHGKCLLCWGPMILGTRSGSGAYVDHDHKTGNIRGLLHNNCNRGIGFFDDDMIKTHQACLYLQKFLKEPIDKSSRV